MSHWQRAFVLHSKAYSETSLLVDLFVEKSGKVTVIAKGARRKKSLTQSILQLFTPLIVQYSGKGEIKTLRQVEAISLALPLSSISLYSAFYLNELVHRVLIAESDTTELFHHYLHSLKQLAQQMPCEAVLRTFELALLENLGYHVDFFNCSVSGDAIVDSLDYQYQSEKGFILSSLQSPLQSSLQKNNHFTGEQVRLFGQRQFENEAILKAAKRFTRMALKPYVGTKPFKSRELFLKI